MYLVKSAVGMLYTIVMKKKKIVMAVASAAFAVSAWNWDATGNEPRKEADEHLYLGLKSVSMKVVALCSAIWS